MLVHWNQVRCNSTSSRTLISLTLAAYWLAFQRDSYSCECPRETLYRHIGFFGIIVLNMYHSCTEYREVVQIYPNITTFNAFGGAYFSFSIIFLFLKYSYTISFSSYINHTFKLFLSHLFGCPYHLNGTKMSGCGNTCRTHLQSCMLKQQEKASV